jgi:para-nitrobenzyl esterase
VNPTVAVEGGLLQGLRTGDVVEYRGIPYAEARRFAAPERPRPWTGVRDATRHGPICPQPESRLAPVTGTPPDVPQDEACLTLSVATSVVASSRPRPVMVWLHGGAYVVGAGSHDWYDPEHLVIEGNVVLVRVNYRLGVLGYLRLAGVSSGNAGLQDQMTALRWVAKNAAAFGGDPKNVTVFGESAGAHSVAALLSTSATHGRLRRAILQSGHLGLGFMKVRSAERIGRKLVALLGDTDPRSASIAELLVAQQATVKSLGGPAGLNSAPIFGPVAGVVPLPEPAVANIARAVSHRDVDLLVGSTRDEMRAFFDSNPRVVRFRRFPVLGDGAVTAVARAVTRRVFTEPAKQLADARARQGARVYRYSFDWAPASDPFGACHTIELPFVFGSETWRDSPMLGGAPWEQVDALGKQMRRAWTRFAWYGDPNAEGDPPWERHTVGAEVGRSFS